MGQPNPAVRASGDCSRETLRATQNHGFRGDSVPTGKERAGSSHMGFEAGSRNLILFWEKDSPPWGHVPKRGRDLQRCSTPVDVRASATASSRARRRGKGLCP